MIPIRKLKPDLTFGTVMLGSLMLSSCGGGGSSSNAPSVERPSTDEPITERPPNISPQAQITTKNTLNAGESVQLSGTLSSDSDGSIRSYSWEQVSGTPVSIQNADASVASFIAPENEGESLSFRLTVTDDRGDSASITSEATINAAPDAVATSENIAAQSAAITLDGSSSMDSDGTIASYRWEQISGEAVTIENADTNIATFTAPDTEGETLEFRLTITDDNGQSVSTITQTITNYAPQAIAESDSLAYQNTVVPLDASNSTDQDGTIESYLWEQISGTPALIEDPSAPQTNITTPNVKGETLEFRLTVTDNLGQPSSTTTSIILNSLPIAAISTPSQEIIETHTFELSGENSTDIDNNISSFTWEQISGPEVAFDQINTETVNVTAPVVTEDSQVEFRLSVTDGFGDTDEATIQLQILANEPPTVNLEFPLPNSRFWDDAITFSGSVTDDRHIDENTVRVQYGEEEVVATVDSDGRWSIQAPNLKPYIGELEFTITATDNAGESSTDESLTMEIAPNIAEGRFILHPQNTNIGYFVDDFFTNKLIEIDLGTGSRDVLWEATANHLGFPNTVVDLLFDEENNRILVLGTAFNSIIGQFDLNTNDYSSLIANDSESGITFSDVSDFEWTQDRSAVYIADNDNQRIVRVDLTTNERKIISGGEVGAGTPFAELNEIVLDKHGQLFAYDADAEVIYSVSIETGNREVFSNENSDRLNNHADFAYDSDSDLLVGLKGRNPSITQVDMNSGDIDLQIGANLLGIWTASQILIDNTNDRYIVSTYLNTAGDHGFEVVAIDKNNGNKTTLFDESLGEGDDLGLARSIAVDEQNQITYTLALLDGFWAITRIDLVTREKVRMPLAIENGRALSSIHSLLFNPTDGLLYFADTNTAGIYSFDPETEERTLLTRTEFNGETINPLEMSFSRDYQSLYISFNDTEEGYAVLAYDITNFASVDVLVDSSNNTTLIAPTSFLVEGNLLYLIDKTGTSPASIRLKEIDLTTSLTRDVSLSIASVISSINHKLRYSEEPNTLYASGADSILSVNLVSGITTPITDNRANGKGNGNIPLNMQDFYPSTNAPIVYYVGTNFEALFAAHKGSGDRIIISK